MMVGHQLSRSRQISTVRSKIAETAGAVGQVLRESSKQHEQKIKEDMDAGWTVRRCDCTCMFNQSKGISIHICNGPFMHDCKLVKYDWHLTDITPIVKRDATDFCVCVKSGTDNDSIYNVARRCNENIWVNAHCQFRVNVSLKAVGIPAGGLGSKLAFHH